MIDEEKELTCERCGNKCKVGFLNSHVGGRVRLLFFTSILFYFLGPRGIPQIRHIVAIFCPYCHNVRLRYIEKDEKSEWNKFVQNQACGNKEEE